MNRLFWGLVLAIALSGSAVAADGESMLQGQTQATVALDEVLAAVARNEDLLFAVDGTVAASVVVGQLEVRDIDYDQLLLVLRNNGLAAVRVGAVTNILPVRTIRQTALPLLVQSDDTINPEEWVTRLLSVQHADARSFVPILRPMLPQQGHLVADVGSNQLIMVDRYANTERIAALVKRMDVRAAPTE